MTCPFCRQPMDDGQHFWCVKYDYPERKPEQEPPPRRPVDEQPLHDPEDDCA